MRTLEADRFQHECDVPDPPLSPKGRQRYWDETVFEAVAELRKRLRGQDTEAAREALGMILDLEKTRIRHAAKVSGTAVPNLSDLEDDWGNPLPRTSRDREGADEVEKTSPPVPLSMNGEGVFKAEAVPMNSDRGGLVTGKHPPVTRLNTPSPFTRMPGLPGRPGVPAERGTGGEVFPLPNPPRIPGVTACFSDRDDDWNREPGAFDNLEADVDPVAAGLPPPPEPRIWC